jgi:hypothetical protein
MIYGRVTSTGSGYCFVDDGSKVADPSGAVGVKVSALSAVSGSISMPTVGEMVRVVGVVGIEPVGSVYRGLVRVRAAGDIKKIL